MFMGSCGLHEGVLQLSALVIAYGDGIHADSHDDAVTVKHLLADAARQTVNLMGVHCVEDIDMERPDLHVRAIVVQDDVKHTAHLFMFTDLSLDL